MEVDKLHLLSLLLEPLMMLFLQLITSCNEGYMQMKRGFLECTLSWAPILTLTVDRHLENLTAHSRV